MIVVETYLKESLGKGIGLFSKKFIKKGTVMWKYNPIVDIIINKKDIPKLMKKFYNTYAVEVDKNRIMLNTDNARFVNHSKNPNMKSFGRFDNNIAIKNINSGEEITIDYEKMDGKINFRDSEKNKK